MQKAGNCLSKRMIAASLIAMIGLKACQDAGSKSDSDSASVPRQDDSESQNLDAPNNQHAHQHEPWASPTKSSAYYIGQNAENASEYFVVATMNRGFSYQLLSSTTDSLSGAFDELMATFHRIGVPDRIPIAPFPGYLTKDFHSFTGYRIQPVSQSELDGLVQIMQVE